MCHEEMQRNFIPYLYLIINCSLPHGVMPDSLKTAMLLPVLKKKNADLEIFSNSAPYQA